jgi:hypothetical protein
MDIENEDLEKEYTEPVDITVDGNTFTWDPKAESLIPKEGETVQDTIDALDKFIYYAAPDRTTISAAPEGPFLPATTQDIYTLVWAISVLFEDSDVVYNGEVPTLEQMGLGEEPDLVDDGDEIVR